MRWSGRLVLLNGPRGLARPLVLSLSLTHTHAHNPTSLSFALTHTTLPYTEGGTLVNATMKHAGRRAFKLAISMACTLALLRDAHWQRLGDVERH